MNRRSISKALLVLPLLSLSIAVDARAQISVASSTIQERQAEPGEIYTGTIRVRNTSAEPHEVRVYQTDYHFTADASSSYPEPNSTSRSNAGWISFSPSRFSISARDEVEISYTVTVPAEVASAGTHWSIFMVEGIAPDDPTTARRDPNARVQVGIRSTVRYAVQVATHVRGPGESRMEFANTTVTRGDGGRAVLRFDVRNTGYLGHRPHLSAEIYDAEGNEVGRFDNQRGLVYPGTGVRQEFEVGGLLPGEYTVLLLADTGGEDIFGAQYQLSFR